MANIAPSLSGPDTGFLYGGPDPLARNGVLPLSGRRVMITAPRSYAGALAARLVAAGARPMWVPGVMTCRLEPGSDALADLDATLRSLMAGDFSHVAFTSRAGVEAVLERLSVLSSDVPPTVTHRVAALKLGGSILRSTKVSVWALGADAQALAAAGVSDIQTPSEPSTDGLARALATSMEGTPRIGVAILCPVPLVMPPLVEPPVVPRFIADLEMMNVAVTPVAAYETSLGTSPGVAEEELRMLANGTIDAIMFTSAAEAQGLTIIAGGTVQLQEMLQQGRERGLLLAAHGPTTAAGVEAVLGLAPGTINVVPKDSSSFGSTVAALENAFCNVNY